MIAAPSRTLLVDLQGFALEDNFAVNDDPVATADAAAEDVTAGDGPGRARAGGPGEDVHVAWLRELTALHDMTAYAPAPRRRPQPPVVGLKPAARRLDPTEAIPPIKVVTSPFPSFAAVRRLGPAEAMHLATEAVRRIKALIQPFLSLPALRRLGFPETLHRATEPMRRIKALIQPFLSLPTARRLGAADAMRLASEAMRRIKAVIQPFLSLPALRRLGPTETLRIASEAMRRIEAGIVPRIRRLASPVKISVKRTKPLVLLRTATSTLWALPVHLWAPLRTIDMFDRIMLAVLVAAAIAYLGALRISEGSTAVATDKGPSSLVARPAPPHVRDR